MNQELESLQELRRILARLGAPRVARFWSNAWRVLAISLLGGVIAGAAASVATALLLTWDVNRGDDSFLYRAGGAIQTVIIRIQARLGQELP